MINSQNSIPTFWKHDVYNEWLYTVVYISIFKGLLTFFTEHAVTEGHLCKGFITLEGSAKHAAVLYTKA